MSFDFKTLDLPVPDTVYNLSLEQQQNIYNYLKQLDETNKKAYIIAYNHLGTSFNIFKSNGYNEWIKTM
jgi:enolase